MIPYIHLMLLMYSAVPKPDMSKYVFIKGINRQENVPLDPRY